MRRSIGPNLTAELTRRQEKILDLLQSGQLTIADVLSRMTIDEQLFLSTPERMLELFSEWVKDNDVEIGEFGQDFAEGAPRLLSSSTMAPTLQIPCPEPESSVEALIGGLLDLPGCTNHFRADIRSLGLNWTAPVGDPPEDVQWSVVDLGANVGEKPMVASGQPRVGLAVLVALLCHPNLPRRLVAQGIEGVWVPGIQFFDQQAVCQFVVTWHRDQGLVLDWANRDRPHPRYAVPSFTS